MNSTNFFILKHNLHSLFAGNFLIHPGYAASFIPTLFQVFNSNTPALANDRLTELQNKSNNKIEMADGSAQAKAVIVISIKQPILKFTDEWMGFLGSKYYMRLMDSFKGDPNIAGIVLDIDSGGGQVYGTAEFYDYIKAYPKPVVTYTDGLLCSAAYYIGNAAKYIVANKRADAIGSLGAFAKWVDFTGLWEKLGAKSHSIYATLSTEKNKDTREAEENANYEPYIKNVLDPIVDTFHIDMKATRPGLNEAVFAGGTWNGIKALEMGLVDELGSLDTAVLKVLELDAQSSNQNPNNMSTKTRAKLQAVLGLAAPLVSTEDKGSYLNDEQLDTFENSLVAAEASAATLQASLDAATTAQTTAEQALVAANTAHTAATTEVEASVTAMLTGAGLTATGTLTDKLTALNSHLAVVNKGDGDKHTTIRTDGKPEGPAAPSYVDANAAHNQLANDLYK